MGDAMILRPLLVLAAGLIALPGLGFDENGDTYLGYMSPN